MENPNRETLIAWLKSMVYDHSFVTEEMQTPSPWNPLGVKGVGESGTVVATPALQSAVLDALAPYGVVHLDLPFSPERVWRAMQPEA